MKTARWKLTPLLGAMLIGCATAGGPDAGNFTMRYTKNSQIPVGDQEGHITYLGEALGMAEGGSKDGSEVLSRDYVDIINGNGEHWGYTTFAKDGGGEIVKWSGKVNTTMNENGTPNTTFGGDWTAVHDTGGVAGRAIKIRSGSGMVRACGTRMCRKQATIR